MKKILFLVLSSLASTNAYNDPNDTDQSPPNLPPTNLNTLSPEFIVASEFIRSSSYNKEGSRESQLELFALFRQATIGDCIEIPRHKSLDFIDLDEWRESCWRAWCSLRGKDSKSSQEV
jgi:acyl-CoA-binding protein